MAHPEVLERRLRLGSFLFVAVAIVLFFGSITVGERLIAPPAPNADFSKINSTQVIVQMMDLFTAERFIVRGLFVANLFMNLGVLFILYLLLAKIREMETRL